MNFICPKCGKVEPEGTICYSFPATAKCPKCGIEIASDDRFRMMSEEEARRMRPEFYRDTK